MTPEEKAKAYDEVLNKAKELMSTLVAFDRFTIERIFPELKENDDEKIRKALIRTFNEKRTNEHINGVLVGDILAWLEKQDKKELANFDEAEKEKADFVGDGFIKCFANFLDFKEGNTYWLEYIGDDKYNVRSDNLLGKTYHITPCQLYTVFKKQIWLEKQGEQKLQGNSALEAINEEKVDNADKDEIEIPFGAKDSELQEATYYIPKGFHTEIDEDKVVIKNGEKPTEWSEEDNVMIRCITLDLELLKNRDDGEAGKAAYQSEIEWLKSIKDRYTWKPSDEQMAALNNAILLNEDHYNGAVLSILHEQLMKLK